MSINRIYKPKNRVKYKRSFLSNLPKKKKTTGSFLSKRSEPSPQTPIRSLSKEYKVSLSDKLYTKNHILTGAEQRVFLSKIIKKLFGTSRNCEFLMTNDNSTYLALNYEVKIIGNSVKEIKIKHKLSKLELFKFIDKVKKQFIGIYVILSRYGEMEGHINVLIIDRINETVTLFEPHGSEAEDYKPVYTLIFDTYFKYTEYQMITPVDYCPKKGLQQIEEQIPDDVGEQGGYCAIWSLLFLYYQIKNPNKTPKQVVDYLLEKTPKDLKTKVRQITEYFLIQMNIENNKYKIVDELDD